MNTGEDFLEQRCVITATFVPVNGLPEFDVAKRQHLANGFSWPVVPAMKVNVKHCSKKSINPMITCKAYIMSTTSLQKGHSERGRISEDQFVFGYHLWLHF